jgi:1-hydroxycarotenoid 3,4-desaturase
VGKERVVIVGAGVGGLSAAVLLAARGIEVIVLETAASPGGKMREVTVGGARIDAGPTVFTMRWVFDEIFAEAGASFSDRVGLVPLTLLARHAWGAEEKLDLFADIEHSVDAIGAFAGGAEARGYRRFCDRARRVYSLLEQPFIRQPEPRMDKLMFAVGLKFGGLWDIAPFSTMWSALGEYFRDDRLRQLFGRYATYCGSSPFLAPATLMLVAHVEQAGVWSVTGGMHQLAAALVRLAGEHGADVRYGEQVAEVLVDRERTCGVRLASGERIDARAVVANVDAAALAGGLLGEQAAASIAAIPASSRSLSAITWALVAKTNGFPLSRHNVFFSRNYAAEFDDILLRSRPPTEPTVYICAQDRPGTVDAQAEGPERLLCLINAPATAETNAFDTVEIARCQAQTLRQLERCGLNLQQLSEPAVVTTPSEFSRLFPGTGGALYGQASHGWRASFERPGCRTRIPGLYLAGGSVHPGPGVPMAALSGRMAAQSLLSDLASGRR